MFSVGVKGRNCLFLDTSYVPCNKEYNRKRFLLDTFPVHVTFIGTEVTKFLLSLFFIHVPEEFSFYFLHLGFIFYIVTSPLLQFAFKTCYILCLNCFAFALMVLHYEFMLHFSLDAFKFRFNWRHNLRLFAPSRLTTCLTLENNKNGGGETKISSHRVRTQLRNLRFLYKQAVFSDNWGKGTILNFLFIHQYFVYAQLSLSFKRRIAVYFF